MSSGVDITLNLQENEQMIAGFAGGAFGLFFQLFLFWVGFQLVGRITGTSGNGPNNPFNMLKSNVEMVENVEENFESVAGADEAKEELVEIVDFLKNPEKYTELGAKIPKGALLIGPPGTGKTLIARAIAGESSVPFFPISASEFIQIYSGVGASRVRDLFKKAKEKAPAIIFIDEIDAVGRSRGGGLGEGNDERE